MNNEEKQQHYDRARALYAEQNFTAAVIAGGIATVLAATAYAITAATLPIALGFAAAGVGIFVGATIGFLGRGIATKFSVLATLYTITGLVLGNVFGPMSDFAPVDLVYWFVAVVAAVFLSKRPLSRADRLAIGLFKLNDQA